MVYIIIFFNQLRIDFQQMVETQNHISVIKAFKKLNQKLIKTLELKNVRLL